MFEAHECRAILKQAHTPEINAMILLAFNAGFGNSDCVKLPVAAIQGDWIDFPRPKTGVERRCPLRPKTVQALTEVMERREQERDLVFLTRWGNTYEKNHASITQEYKKLLTTDH